MRFYKNFTRFYQSVKGFEQSSMRFYQSKMRICETFMIFNQFSWNSIKKCCMRFDHRFLSFYEILSKYYEILCM